MKALLVASCWILLYGCASDTNNQVNDFIPGTYIRFGEQEFGKEWDTLTISLQNPMAKEYRIQRAWRYARVLDGRALEPTYKVKQTTAIYDDGKRLLHEMQTGNTYSFNPNENTIFAGTTKYQKLK